MKKIHIPIIFRFIFLMISMNSIVYASDLTIPANSACEVRLSNSMNTHTGHKEKIETAVIICDSTNKNDNNKLDYEYARITHQFSDGLYPYSALINYHSYNSPTNKKWRLSLDGTGKNSI